MEDLNFNKKRNWYSSWWGIVLLIILCVVFAAIIAFTLLIFNYFTLIKSGKAELLNQKFNLSILELEETEEIKEIRRLIETRDDPYLGNINSRLVITVFLDFSCPISANQMEELKKIVSKYGYDLKIILKDFPIETLYLGTTNFHEIASCANEQGLYWFFSDYFFNNQSSLNQMNQADLISLINEFGGNLEIFNNCLQAGRGKKEVEEDYLVGHQVGVKYGTPTVFINGNIVGSGGLMTFDFWEKLIKELSLI